MPEAGSRNKTEAAPSPYILTPEGIRSVAGRICIPAFINTFLPDAAAALAQSVGAKTASVDEVLASDVDAILIATPTDTHADLIEKAANAGKAILCEKPVSLSVERIEACLPVVEKAGVPLMIGFHRRYDPNFGNMKQRIDQGEIGDVEMVTITCRDPSAPPVAHEVADYSPASGGARRRKPRSSVSRRRGTRGQ